MTVRFPRDVYENLRREAYVTRRPMNELVTESVAARYTGTVAVQERIGRLSAAVEPVDTP